MKKILEYIIANITANPQTIEIEEKQENNFSRFIISVPKEQIGSIIGQNGRIIKSIKTILAAFGKNNHFSLEIEEKTN